MSDEPPIRDVPIDGQNVCPNGCFLSLVARRYQDRVECPHCGASLAEPVAADGGGSDG